MNKENRLASWLALPLGITIMAASIDPTHAVETPEPSEHDARVRYVTYEEDDVTLVTVRRGVLTRIVLGDGEKIERSGSGFPSNCEKPEYEWCIVADEGTNQIWVKPKDRATHNNMEVRTNRRNYSFEFKVLEDSPKGRGELAQQEGSLYAEPMFRVIMRYPVEVPKPGFLTGAAAPMVQPAVSPANLSERMEDTPPTPRNWDYTMEVLKGGEAIAPALVFDDGRFTYFRFSGNREIPSIYYISPAGEESRVNFHMEGDLAVVQRMGERFVLRLGKSVVGVWNENFDIEGVPPADGTTVDSVKRVVR